MILEINRVEFLKAWQAAERSCSPKSSVAAATGILIKADENGVSLEATDFKTAVKCSAEGVNV
ncbi:MAG: DNA polymerase III subunit beta, partial [Synergistaceae bacterium]|nr:DNA polymerase III subunit beta [Synergistaceae bacterium]